MVLEILQFVFSSFWVWLGTVILCNAIFGNLRGILTKTVTNVIKEAKKEKA